MLQLRTFLPSSDKVRQVEFHPVQPWAVSCTKSDHVCVWDWSNRQVLHEVQLGGSEEELLQDMDVSRLGAADASFQPNPSLGTTNASRSSTGHVKDVKFLDLDVAQAQLTTQHYLVNGPGSSPPRAEAITALQGCRLLVIVCEAKVLLYDLLTRKTTEISRGLLEGRSPSCVSFLFMGGAVANKQGSWLMASPLLAFGCSDGITRLVQLSTMKPVCRLSSAHKTPVLSTTVMAVRGCPWEQVLVAHQSGNVTVYEPLSKVPGSDVASKVDIKAHDKDVVGVCMAAVHEDVEGGPPQRMVFTAGVDQRVLGHDPATLKEAIKIKMDPKTPVTCMSVCPRAFVASGAHTLLLGTELGLLLSCQPTTQSMRLVCNLALLIPAGTKKAPKIYSVTCHPYQPQLLLVGTNSGSALLGLQHLAPLPVCPLPLRSPLMAHSSSLGGAIPSGSGATYLVAVGDGVTCVTCSTVKQAELGRGLPSSQAMGKLPLASGKPTSRAVMCCSGDGEYVGVVWPAARQYAVYRQGAAAWQECGGGSAISIAWHSTDHTFAVVEQAAPPPPPLPSKPGKVRGKKEKEEEARRMAEAAVAAAAAANMPPVVQIRSVRDRSLTTLKASLPLGPDQPAGVTSGPLLGVTLRRGLAQSDLVAGVEQPAAFQFFAWDTCEKVGPELPEPLIVAWDPSLQFCALAYSSQVLIFTTTPAFHCVAALPLAHATCIEWAMRQVYIATPTHIYCAYVSGQPTLDPLAGAAGSALPSLPLLVTLASFDDPALLTSSISGSGSSSSAGVFDTCMPAPLARPPGPLVLLGPRDGNLWLVNAHCQPLALPLSHPGFRAFSLVASGDLLKACALAAQQLPPGHHDQLAAFMVAMDGMRGAGAALSLAGLSLKMELRLRLINRQWHQAVEACEALLAGYQQRPPPGQFAYTAASAAFGTEPSRGTVGLSLGMLPDPMDLGGLGGGSMVPAASSCTYPSDLDWSAPLREAGSSARALAAVQQAGGAGAGTGAQGPALDPQAVDMTLLAAHLLLSSGLHDVAKQLARLLLAHCARLGPGHMSRLAGLMSECGMKQDMAQLLHHMVPGAAEMGREAAGLLSALLSGHTSLVQDVLREGSCHALAALQASSYNLAQQAASTTQWRAQLGGLGAVHLSVAPPASSASL